MTKEIKVAPTNRLVHSKKFLLVETASGFINQMSPSPDSEEKTPDYKQEQYNSDHEEDKNETRSRLIASKLIRSRSECQFDKNGSFAISVIAHQRVRFSFSQKRVSVLKSKNIKSMENLHGLNHFY